MKTCSKCGTEKPLSDYNKDRSHSDGHRSQCRVCERERKRMHRIENNAEYRERDRERRGRYSESIRETHRNWSSRNRERIAEYGKKGRENLREGYVKGCLRHYGFGYEDMTEDLVEAQRALIKLKREIKK